MKKKKLIMTEMFYYKDWDSFVSWSVLLIFKDSFTYVFICNKIIRTDVSFFLFFFVFHLSYVLEYYFHNSVV